MIQHFMDGEIHPRFRSCTRPQLYYMGKILPEISVYPRILHAHANHVEISIIYSGASQYMIRDGKQEIRPGDMLIYNSNTVHDELSGADSQIGSYFFAIGNLEVPGLRPNALIADDVGSVFHIQKDFASVTALCETMLENLNRPGEWSDAIVHFLTQALLEIIWRVIHTEQERKDSRKDYALGRKIKAYIDAHYCEPINMKQICAAVRMSESYISHVFKDMLGYSPMQYALRRKIGEAQTLLISTEYSISRIAQMVGFDAQSHFNQRFSKYVGIAPGQFRKNYRGQNGKGTK